MIEFLFPISIILGLVAGLLFLRFLTIFFSKRDTRESYFRNENGKAMGVKIIGSEGRLPSHEDFMHDGLPHQNPLVIHKNKFSFNPFNPFWVEETRIYPITVNPNISMQKQLMDLQNNIIRTNNPAIKLVELTDKEEEGVFKVETENQVANGVEFPFKR